MAVGGELAAGLLDLQLERVQQRPQTLSGALQCLDVTFLHVTLIQIRHGLLGKAALVQQHIHLLIERRIGATDVFVPDGIVLGRDRYAQLRHVRQGLADD